MWTLDAAPGRPDLRDAIAAAPALELGDAPSPRASVTRRAPLAGVRVLDLSRLLPGSLGSARLREEGAEVIKIELPHSGDYMRELEDESDHASAPRPFSRLNAGKKSVSLDYRCAEGSAVLRRMGADTLEVLERFGFERGELASLKAGKVIVVPSA